MGIYRKVLRYGLKKQAEASQGSLARTADRLRILSSVLAAGFVVLPFFCGEAFAAGSIVRVDSDKNLMQSGRADIYAESVHGDVGLNRFKDFKVENQELANLYFQQAKDSAVFNTLVNTVDSRIDINGTVNAIRDNKVGGNLYFLSKDGMIVGTSGVVNAGSLTVLAAENSFENAKAASEALQKQNWELSSKGTIDVSGTLNTATGIDLRAAYINVAKAKGSSFVPQLRTGMLFYTTVNTDGLVSNAAVKDGRLTATVDSSGNIVIADPNDADNAALKGDGSIKLQASATKKNAAQMFLNSDSLKNTVEAKVNIAEGAKLDAAGDVLVSAEATHDSNRNVVEILDIAAFAKADVKVDGELKGRNITVTANAVNSLDSKNLKSIYDGLDRTAEEITNAMGYKITVNDALADAIGSTLEDRGVFGKGGKYFDTVNNVIEQLYMPFGFANAEATISVGSAGKFTASENISAAANSTASNNFKVEIQPKLQQGDANKLKYFTGGFVYVDTDSKATVNIYGKLKAEKNLAVTAKAVDTSIGTMVVKPPRILDNGQGGDSKDDGSFYTGLAMAMNFQNSAAVVNLGTAGSAAKDKNNPLLKAGGALTVNAVNVNTLASTASITVKENTPLNTTINISSTQGKAVINDNAALEGAQVQLNSKHMLNKLSVTADSSIGPELSGSQWVVNTPQAKHGLDELRKFLSGVNEGPKVSAAAGPNIKKDKKTWDQYFNFGMSFGLALVDNEARTNIAAGVPITATGGNLALTAAVSIGDSQFATKNLLNAANRDDPLGVSAAIGVEDMHNTAEVNAAEDSGSELAAKGNINITANVDNSYQRVNKLVDAVKSGWESFYNYWSTGGKLEDDAASDAKAKVQQIETIVADILTMASKNSAEAFVKDKQFAMKSKAAMEILTELTGATELKNALENLLNASNYANMYVSASTDKPLMSKPDITTMITGTVGVQNLANNAKVNIGAHKRLTAGADVALAASVTEQNALLAGKWQLIPDIFTNDAGQNGLGASVGVQNAANKSEVRVNNGVGISAGSGAVAMQTANDIINTSLVMGGAKTSSLGITGMVNYVGGSSAAETLVDDDVSLSAAKKLRLAAANDTVLTAVTGDFGYSQGSSVGVSTSVIDYNVKTLAQLRNLEGTDSAGKGSITASALEVNAHTDGVINNFALAGVASKSSNVNKDAGGVSTSTSDGKAKEGVEKAEVKAEEKKDDTSAGGSDKNDDKVQGTLRAGGDKKNDSKKLEESVIKVDAAGSVAWNYVKDETDASIDNVQIELLRPAGTDKTTSVDIAAEDSSYIGAYSGSAALSKFGFAGEKASSTKFEGMLSGAIAVNDVHKSTTSALRRAEFNNADNVTNLAQNSGAQAAAGLAMGVELGKRAGSVDINLGGSGSANYVDSTVLAEMTGNVMKNGALNVSNVAYDKDVQAGGGINFEFSRGNAAAGAAISISDVDNKISAVMQDNRIGTQDKLAGSISNLALSNLVQVGTATSIGVLVGSKAYFMGDVAIAVNMVDNDVQAQADSNTIYAQSVANEARDGKLQVNEKQNKYIDAINSTADNGITVEKETGKFYKLDANGSKQYIVGEGASYVYEDNGAAADLYDANNKISYDETTGKLTDSHGRTLVFNSKRSFVDEKTKAGVDVTAAAAANILDLDAQAALAQANGSQGVALGAEENKDGSLTYKSKTLTAESAGNVIVGSAIAVAAKASEGSYGGSAAVATNINHIKNSFNAAASDNNITASGKDGVKITAASDTLMVAVAAGAAASAGTDKVSVDLAGSGVDNTLHNDTLASLTGGNIKADNVEAVSSTKSLLVGVAGQLSAVITGQYGGAAGLTWAQSDLDNTTGAYVSGLKLTGYNGKNKLFKAEAINDSSIVTVGAGVTTVDDKASILAGLADSKLQRADKSADVKVTAKNKTSIETEVSSNNMALSLGAAIGTGVEVVNLEAQTAALVKNSQLGDSKNAFHNIDITADNEVSNKFTNVVDSTASLAGVAVGVGVANINTQTTTTVDGSKLYADNIKVTADERRTADAQLVGAAIGGLAVGVNLMYTNLGGELQDAYTYDVWNENKQSYDTYTTYTQATDSVEKQYVTDIQGIAGEGLTGTNAALKALPANSVAEVKLNKGSAAGKVGVNIKGSTLEAGQAVQAAAHGTNNVNSDIRQAAVAGASVAVAGNHTRFREEQSVQLAEAIIKGKSVDISSLTDGNIKHYTGQGGFSIEAYSDTVSYIKHSGANKLQINGSTITATDKATLSAQNKVQLDNKALAVNIGGVSAGRLVLESKDSLAAGVELGKQTAGSVEGKSISITAENAGKVKDEIEAGVTVGVISIHGSSAESRALGAADVYVGAGSSLRADSAELQAKIGRDSDYTTEAINHAVSVSAGLDVTVNRALTENAMQSNVYLGDISAGSKLAALRVQALNNNSSNAYVYSFGLGIIAGSGNNFAKAEENSTVAISLDGGKGLTLQQLDVLAENVQSVTAKADGSASALLEISPYTAKATHDAKAQTSVTLKGELTAADSMSVQALRRENTNLKADALTSSLAGGGDASADNKSTGKAFVEASAAKLTSGSDMLLKADNNVKLNRAEGYNEMLWGQGYSGLVGVNTAGVDNSITAETAVRLQDSSLQSKKGHVQLASQSEEDLLVNAYVYSSGIIDATETRVTNNINNDNRIELTNSNIKTSTAYKDITLAAADDLKLYTSAIAETPIGVLAGSNAVVKNALQRTNALGLYGAGELYSMNDINYYAGKHLDGSLGRIELDAQAINYNGSVIPVVLSPSLNNEVTQQNELFMQSGASNSVRHTNIYADAGEELVFVHTGRDTSYGGDEEGGYVTEDTGSKHYNKLDKNSVDINGSMAAGMDNRINIVVGAAGDIALFDEDERKSLTNKTALSKEELQGKITVAGSEVLDAQGKPTGAHSGLTEETAATIKDSIKLGSVDYAQTLMNRYNEIMLLISEYASDGADSASYIGYKAEAERLLSQMEKMGEVSYVDGKYVLNARKMVDYVEIPELTASGGNIAINTSVLKSSKATGSLAANGSPEINVTNNTNLMLRLQRINVDDGGGRLLYNNEQLTGSTSSDFNNNISKLNKKDNAASGGFQSVKSETGIGGSINIKGNYSGAPLDYRVVEDGKTSYGQYLPQADIIVSGDVYNKNGSIKITSQNNNITIAGASAQDSVSVLGASVALSAGGSITQTFTDGIVNIDHDPRQFFNKQYDKLKKDKKNIYDITGPNGEPYDGMEPTGSFIAGGVISINATDINVDGIVQSGYGDYGLWMSNDKNVEAAINKIKSSYKEGDKLTDDYVKGNDAYQIVKGSAYWDYDAKCYKYRIGAYYNPASNTIILEDVNASGGQIYLTGRISSIGAGRLYCLDGTSNITIESNLPYNMKLGSLITNDVKGRVSITDTAGYSVSYNNKKIPVARVTEYTNGMMETYYVSSGGTKYEYMATYFDGGKGGEYKPKAGLRYTWTTGTKNTDYKRYTHDDMDGGWGLWDLEEKDKDLQEWSTQENLTGSGSSANEARKDGVVVQETNDTRKTFMEYEHNQLGETVRTIESERYYSTGLFGCHKHHEVTWKEETGSTDTYFASAKADYPIEVKFLGQKAEESAVKVHNVMGGIEMSGSIGNTQLYEGTDAAGNITHNTKGTVLINSGRIDVGEPVKQSGGALYGRIISVAGTGNLENINIAAGDDVYLKLKSWSQAGGEVKVNVSNLAGAKGRLHLDANSGELSESGYRWKLLDITNSSSNGDIIYAGNNAIEADRINLTAANGSIYGDGSDGSAMKIKAGQNAAGDDSLSASINVKAKGDINIEQVEGNLRLGRVYSSTGDVTLKSAGSIIDALPEEAAAKGSEESRLQRWKNIGLIEGGNSRLQEIKSRLNQEKGLDSYAAWDKTALLYAVSESILQKTAESLDQTSTKDPNVIGRNITLTANGSVGQRGETKEITLTGILAKNADGSYKNANALNDLKTLGQADVTNVTLRKAADGKQIAVIDETQTLGIQQTTSNGQGKINIQAAAKGGQGDIFLQGREEVSLEKSFAGRASKDLNIETLMTGNGRATVTSLGSINKLAAEPEAVNIQAQSLYLTAINGVGSTGALNVSLYGQDEANDGLSVISGGAVAINQLGDKQLVLQHLSTGKDAGSYLKILADNDIVLHGDAPDSESITLQSRGGSITAGELTGNDITLSARKGSLDIDRLEAQGLLRAEAERMHFGDASIGHGSIRPGREAVFDRLRTNGLAQFHNVSQYQVYDLGDGLQLRLTAGGRSPYDALVQFDNALHEFCSQRLYATGVLGTKLEYDVHEKLFGPQIRPGILFDRYNLIEQEEAEEKI